MSQFLLLFLFKFFFGSGCGFFDCSLFLLFVSGNFFFIEHSSRDVSTMAKIFAFVVLQGNAIYIFKQHTGLTNLVTHQAQCFCIRTYVRKDGKMDTFLTTYLANPEPGRNTVRTPANFFEVIFLKFKFIKYFILKTIILYVFLRGTW